MQNEREVHAVGKIVGIGGGSMEALETLPIDKAVVELSGKDNPRALFIPTASYDSVERWEIFRNVYGKRLGCQTDVLYLLGRKPPRGELKEKILSADLIYASGGNTLKMMRRWRLLGVDGLLYRAYNNGVPLAGVSAGMICWFKWGHSDSMSFYHPEDWNYIRVRGMGLIDALGCPHFHGGTGDIQREEDFKAMVARYSDVGIAIDDHCAVEFVDGGYRVIATRTDVGAYRLYRQAGGVEMEPLEKRGDYSPLQPVLDVPNGGGR